jgi:hypothetical protein
MTATVPPGRWIWPPLSLLCGAVMGAMLGDSPPSPLHSNGRRAQEAPVRSDRVVISKGEVAPLVIRDSPSTVVWPAAVARQLADPHFLNHSRTVWLPAEFVDKYRWNPGAITGGCKLSADAKRILDVNEAEAVRVEQAIDRFVSGIREIESRHAIILEKTSAMVTVRVPEGLTANGPRQQLEAELLPIVGPVLMRSLYVRITQLLENISPVMSARQFEIRSTLLEGNRMETFIVRQGGGRSTWHVFPEHFAHLLPPIVGSGDARRWQ